MKYTESYDQEINFGVLIVKTLKKWRVILACTICFAILLGGVQGYKGMKEVNSYSEEEQKKTYDEDMKLYKDSMTNLALVKESVQKNLDNKKAYVENSIKMQIDPFQECVSSADVMVTVGASNPRISEAGYTEKILNTYMSLITSDQVMDKIKQQLGLDVDIQYIRELITLTINKSTWSVNVKVIYANQETAKQILEMLLDGVKEDQQNVVHDFGEHNIEVTNRGDYLAVDNTLDSFQKGINDTITSMQATLASKNKEINALEKPVMELGTSLQSVIKKLVIYAAVGAVLGAIFGLFIMFVGVAMKDDIYDTETLRVRCGLKYIGHISSDKKKHNWIDRVVDRLENAAEISLSDKDEDRLMALNLLNYSDGCERILLVGPAEESTIQLAKDRVEKGLKLQQKCRNVEIAPDIFSNPESVEKLQDCNDIVLVGSRGKTLYSQIDKTVRYLQDLEKNIVGIILE